MKVPSISVGRVKNPMVSFDKSFDNHTTSGFGFVQPLMCTELIPNSKAIVNLKSWVLLAPLVKPTFGRMSWNTYHYFVPMSTLFEPFDNMLTGTPYWTKSGNVGSYVPTQVPCINIYDLTLFVLTQSYEVWRMVKKTSSTAWNFDTSTSLANITSYLDTNLKYSFITGTQTYFANAGLLLNASAKKGPSAADFCYKYTSGEYDYIICFKFGRKAKNLRKVLIGCGYQLSLRNSSTVSILPLLAYYKAWFDLFEIKRAKTWTGTDAFRLIHYCSENNDTYPTSTNWHLFYDFLYYLSDCYYTENCDYITAHRATPSTAQTMGNPNVSSSDTLDYRDAIYSGSIRTNNTSQPNLPHTASLTRNALLMLNRFTKLVNKNSVIGQQIDKILESRYGITASNIQDSNYIGSDIVNCEVNEVMSTAETSEAFLGEYAGKGIGQNDFKKFVYDNTGKHSQFGFYVVLACVVPKSGYIQMQNSNGICRHVRRYDFYHPEFDALGFQITPFSDFVGSQDGAYSGSIKQADSSFGFIPRYSEYKFTPGNIANGDISLHSTRENMLVYTLDKFFLPDGFNSTLNADGTYYIGQYHKDPEVVNDSLRYIGKYASNGNYDRIFVTNNPPINAYTDMWANTLDDNFVIHNMIDFKLVAPMKSFGESFDTETDGGAIQSNVTMA